jgi:hypothetical protein
MFLVGGYIALRYDNARILLSAVAVAGNTCIYIYMGIYIYIYIYIYVCVYICISQLIFDRFTHSSKVLTPGVLITVLLQIRVHNSEPVPMCPFFFLHVYYPIHMSYTFYLLQGSFVLFCYIYGYIYVNVYIYIYFFFFLTAGK